MHNQNNQPHQGNPKFQDTCSPSKTKPSYRVMWLILFVCILPVALSSLVWWMDWGPRAKTQGGLLVQPVVSASSCYLSSNGRPLEWPHSFHRKWVLVIVHPQKTNDFREYLATQLRTMQGKERERVIRASLLAEPNRVPQQDGIGHWNVSGDWCTHPFSSSIQVVPVEHRLYLVDPLGNIVMVFDDRVSPKALHKDLTRLLLVSQVG